MTTPADKKSTTTTATNTENPSTIQSYIDSATSTVQSIVNTITGNTTAAAQPPAKTPHPTTHVGSVAVSDTGVAVDNADRIGGRKDQMVGSGKEFIGDALGSSELSREGRRQHNEGQGREAGGQVKDYVSGAGDRVVGTVGGAIASITGNAQAQDAYQQQRDHGKTSMGGVEAEVNEKK